jgi:hypothetical protein
MLIAPARDLANFDIELIEIDIDVNDPDFGIRLMRATDENPRRFGLSRVWVLAAYELIRTVEQLLRPAPGGTPPAIHVQAFNLKRRLERLRIPLAKFETARNFPNDWPVAYPGKNEETGAIGWRVAPAEFIERRALADELLQFLEDLAASHRQVTQP